MENRICEHCKKEFTLPEWKVKYIKKWNKVKWGRFCSKSCKTRNDDRFWKKGHIPWSKGKKGLTLNSGRTHFKKGFTPWNKGKRWLERTGINHHAWKGGITKLTEKIRKCFLYSQWRIAIFKRDKYVCQICNKYDHNFINADHFPKSFAQILTENNIKTIEEAFDCKELWDLDNGRTLCIDCHRKTKTYFISLKCLKNKYG
jgi:hypothetical protein